MTVLIVILAVLMGAGLLKTIEYQLSKPKALKFDPVKTRALEMEVWGQYFTPLPEGKKKAEKCSACKVPLDDDGWCSNGCVRIQPRIELLQNTVRNCTGCAGPLHTNQKNFDLCQKCTLETIKRRKAERETGHVQGETEEFEIKSGDGRVIRTERIKR